MPAGKRGQGEGWLYAAVTFVGLFIIAAAVAVIFYVKYEEQLKIAQTKQEQTEELAKNGELNNIGSIVGEKPRDKSWIGTMVNHLDQTVRTVIGGPLEDTSAEVKVERVMRQTEEALGFVMPEYIGYEQIDPNLTGLVRVVELLGNKLDSLSESLENQQQRYEDLEERYNNSMMVSFEKEEKLLAEKRDMKEHLQEVEAGYEKLKSLLKKSSEERVQKLMQDLEQEQLQSKELKDKWLQTEAKLTTTQDKLKQIKEQIELIHAPPDIEIEAFEPDGKVILVDQGADIAHINIGRDDQVYPGLTFAVYDKAGVIPRGGKGKAEIKVYSVEKNVSVARIVQSEMNRPIIEDDIIANLLWHSDQTNEFVVAGSFDLEGDGHRNEDGTAKVERLIEKWGGKVADEVSINTDFVILGEKPRVLGKPSYEELEVDPLAQEKYERSVARLERYRRVKETAELLWVPMFNYERFLYFTGYKTLSQRPGAFK